MIFSTALACSSEALAGPIAIPNGDFSSAANDGSAGGGLLGASGTGPIGIGPWQGAYAGVLGLLAPPTLTIGNGQGQITGLGVVALGLNNNGAFTQTLAAPYVAQKHYVLAADIDAGATPLSLAVLSSGNAGMALTSGGSTLAQTTDAPNVSLSLSARTTYHLALGYDSGDGDSGSIGVALFANPAGVLAANLFGHVAFRNVVLTQAPIPALPPDAVGPAGGTPQAASVNTSFSAPLVVTVVDAEGDPLAGVPVAFAAPADGASAALSATSVVTDLGGRAQVTGSANGSAGNYVVTATVDGVAQPATFHLTNSPAGQPAVLGVADSNEPQAATVGSAFACELRVQVVANSAPAAGATVAFQAPIAGASALLGDGTNSGSTLVETTDANGFATVSATANATAGSYDVTATATSLSGGALGTPVLLATWRMSNLAAGDALFAYGFDPVPDPCGHF